MTTSGFASPWVLLLLIPVLLLPLQGRFTGRLALLVPRAADLRASPLVLFAYLPLALRMAGLALLVVALARPQQTRTDVMVESEGLDILLAIDSSCSMDEADMGGGVAPLSRLKAAQRVAAQFVEGRPHDRIGVVAFGEEAFTQCPLTTDHVTLQELIASIEIGVAGGQGTAVGTAIAVGAKRLKELEAPSKILILLTDGRSNAGQISPIEAAQAAGAVGVRLYTIGVGSGGRGLLMPFGGAGPDEEGLTQVAELTGGRYFRASDSRSLADVFEAIGALEPSPAEVRQLVEHEERFRFALVPGVLLLILDLLLSSTLLRRGP